MWDWIAQIVGWGANNLATNVVPWVRDILHGLWGWISALFGNVGKAWHELAQAADTLLKFAERYHFNVYAMFLHILKVDIPAVIRWTANQIERVIAFADKIWHDLNLWVAQLIQRIANAVHFLINWVVVNVWRPLKADFLLAWHWITTDGALVFYYITHPDKLVLLFSEALIAWLEKEAWSLGARLGKFFLGLIVNNLKQFVLLIEDILTAVL